MIEKMNLKNKNIRFIAVVTCLLLVCCGTISCKKFVDIDPPKGKLDPESTFSKDGSATAAVLDVYAHYEADMLYINTAAGVASDEMNTEDFFLTPFLNNDVPLEGFVNDTYLWATPFYQIRRCNLAIEGIGKSASLTPSVKDQLLGEAYFLRALQFFNLVNLYGGVPLSISPAEAENAMLARSDVEAVWKQIFLDLQQAKTLLKPAYPTGERARANQYAASALLARAYLYHKDWDKAEAEATVIIGSGVYSLVSPALTFKNNSNETILQLYSQMGTSSLAAGYIPYDPDSMPMVYLRNGFEQAFEKNGMQDDARKTNWTATNSSGTHYINKYKQATGPGNEYTILLRLGEVYLIRAEARAWQDKLQGTNGAEADLNAIRGRAVLGAKLNLGKTDLLKAIEQERKVELFGEYMHRWFDLKRSPGFTDPSKSRAEEVLKPLKGAFWQAEDILFPIPGSQIALNPALIQNKGY
jgi:hypothetical protein